MAEAVRYDRVLNALRTERETLRRQLGHVDFGAAADGTLTLPPFELPAKALLQLVARECRFRDSAKERASLLRRQLESCESQALLTAVFW